MSIDSQDCSKNSQFHNSDLLSKVPITLIFHQINSFFLAGIHSQVTKLQIEGINQEKISTIEQEQLLKNWANKIVKEIRIFILEEYKTDLGEIDITTGFEYVIMPSEFMITALARTFLQGKVANNFTR